jgi:hypothetical protein
MVVFGRDIDFSPSHGVVFPIDASMTAKVKDPIMGSVLLASRWPM